jgi:hypothetical protein
MNGMITGEMTLNAAIYQREVCDVCLNCEHVKCINTIHGCAAFRAALKANSRKYDRGDGKCEANRGGKDPAGVGRGVQGVEVREVPGDIVLQF